MVHARICTSSPVSRALVTLLALAGLVASGGAEEPETPSTKRIAAEVGTGQITADRVIETWGPTWHEVIANVISGKLTPQESGRQLQAAWETALESAIRSEIFYQEAERSFEQDLRKRADQIAEAQRAQAGPGSLTATRDELYNEMKRGLEKKIARNVEHMLERYTQAAGGLEQLQKVIQRRNISWIQWRERIRQQILADSYIAQQLSPRVPKNPRPADIRRYYKKHKSEFTQPGAVTFRHILFDFKTRGGEETARVAAINVYDAIMAGRFSFADAASRFSDDTESKPRGGLEDAISPDPDRERWLNDIRENARKLDQGAIGSILISERGCHLVQLVRAAPDVPIPFDKAQNTIEQRIFRDRWEAETDKLYEQLRTRVVVRVLMPNFPQEQSWAAIKQRQQETARPVQRIGVGAGTVAE